MSTKQQNTNDIVAVKSVDEIKEHLIGCKSLDDPDTVLKEIDKELSKSQSGNKMTAQPESNLFKSLTLLEFDNGTLLTTVVPAQYKTFGIDLMRNIQKEYNCQTAAEKATAELIAMNYIRILEIQRRINNYLSLGTITDTGARFLSIMSQELDRANRHYLTAI